MHKLQANLHSVSKLVSNDLNMQFNLNICFVNICDNEAIAIASRANNLYKMNFVKIHRADATILVQSLMENCVLEL